MRTGGLRQKQKGAHRDTPAHAALNGLNAGHDLLEGLQALRPAAERICDRPAKLISVRLLRRAAQKLPLAMRQALRLLPVARRYLAAITHRKPGPEVVIHQGP